MRFVQILAAGALLFASGSASAATFHFSDKYGADDGGLSFGADGSATSLVDGVRLTVTSEGGKISRSGKGIGVNAPGRKDEKKYLEHDEALRFEFDPKVISVLAFVFEGGSDGDGFYFKVGDVKSDYIEFGRDGWTTSHFSFSFSGLKGHSHSAHGSSGSGHGHSGGKDNSVASFDLSEFFTAEDLNFPISSFEIIGGMKGQHCSHAMWKKCEGDDGVKVTKIVVEAVPVPAAGVLLLTGLAGLLVLRRRQV